MRWKLDENLPVELAHLLADQGWDCLTVPDQALAGRPDSDIAEVCRAEGRILVTLDIGFADIRSYPPERYPGILVLRLRSQAKPHVLEVAGRLLPTLQRESPKGQLWIVEDQRLRIRTVD
jgi:predicted nuclease of predicted toxin-antitoxin system